ncbi:hypothetical protein CWC33_12290 [Idiomarina sp. X4]|uniref:hypothetical protein n=1 Tax=Idiomarina sp. X4 TaxID=2055892 RepID=UPI000C293DF4|nr:hypothetical protein [Idiomarina sp. X4]ATZ74428.1 hypothetical protein CWC33_12290 [Idiomarina sp. X4]
MFRKTQKIIEETEVEILGGDLEASVPRIIRKYVFLPTKCLKLGIGEFFRPASVCFFISVFLSVIALISMNQFQALSELSVFIYSLVIIIPALLSIFSVPSTYVNYGVTDQHIDATINVIERNGVKSEAEIEMLTDNIEKVNNRIDSRIKFYKLTVGAVWAVYLFFFNIQFRVLLGLGDSKLQVNLTQEILDFGAFVLMTIIALSSIVSYKKACDVLIKSIEFSCSELKLRYSNDAK